MTFTPFPLFSVLNRLKQTILKGISYRTATSGSKTKSKIFLMITIAILVSGFGILSIGLIPQPKQNYVLVAQCQAPVEDQNGTFVTDPAQYCVSHDPTIGHFDTSTCLPVGSVYKCSFYSISRYTSGTDLLAQGYGAAIIAVGGVALAILIRPMPKQETEPTHNSRKIRILINEGICVANSVCVGIAPKVFQLEPEKRGAVAPKVKVIDPYGADNNTIIEAAKMCPTQAIIIEDVDTGERVFPLSK